MLIWNQNPKTSIWLRIHIHWSKNYQQLHRRCLYYIPVSYTTEHPQEYCHCQTVAIQLYGNPDGVSLFAIHRYWIQGIYSNLYYDKKVWQFLQLLNITVKKMLKKNMYALTHVFTTLFSTGCTGANFWNTILREHVQRNKKHQPPDCWPLHPVKFRTKTSTINSHL